MCQIIHYINCPVCGSASFNNVLTAKDFTVSNDFFSIVECNDCTFRFTQDVPGTISILPYYKSENYISHTNTSKGLINRLYQIIRKRTLKQKRKLVEKITDTTNGQLLDVGSGTGAFINEMKQHSWQVTGLEPDADARLVAKQLHNIELSNISELNQLPANSFDAITLWHVMEHVHELNFYVEQLKKILKENGKLFIAVPNYTSKDAMIYQEFWAAYDVPRHLYHFSPQSMKTLIEKHELRLLNYKPMWFDSFYISMLSSKYKNGKTNLLASFLNGLRSNFTAMKDVKRCSSVVYVIGK